MNRRAAAQAVPNDSAVPPKNSWKTKLSAPKLGAED